MPVPAEQDRVYLRLYSATAGTFSATLLATAGSYRTEGVEVRGDATAAVDFPSVLTSTDSTGFFSLSLQ